MTDSNLDDAAVFLGADSAVDALHDFLQANPLSSISAVEVSDGVYDLAIQRPWGDASVLIMIPNDIGPFADALNKVILPTRYS